MTNHALRRLFRSAAGCLCLAVHVTVSTVSAQIMASEWSEHASSLTPRTEGAGIIYDGKLYALAGFERDAKAATVSEVYDPELDSWSPLAPVPRAVSHIGAARVDGRIWLVGGFEGDHPGPSVDIVQIYDIDSDSWISGPPLPVPRASGTLALIGRKLHYVGGLLPDRSTDVGDHFVLDVDDWDGGWTTAAPLPQPRNHLSSAVHDGKLYAIGGQFGHDGGPVLTDLVHVYDPEANAWTPRASMPIRRSHAEASTFVFANQIIVAGGQQPPERPQRSTDLIHSYDPAADRWSEIGRLPEALLGSEAGVIGDRFFVANGSIGLSSNAQSTTWSIPFFAQQPLSIETGTVQVAQSDRYSWHNVVLENTFVNPVVIVSPVSYNGRHPCMARVRNVTPSGFEFRVEEWNYLDGAHTSETIHYVVVESGRHILGEGRELEARTISASSDRSRVSYLRDFSAAPVVLAQIVTANDERAATTRLGNVTADGFDVQLQGQESNRQHGIEVIAYLAVSEGGGTIDTRAYSAGTTGRTVNHAFSSVDFGHTFPVPPVFLASMQSANGMDTATLRYRHLSPSSVELKIDEEKSKDAETAHTSEAVGVFAIEPVENAATVAFRELGGQVVMEAEHWDATVGRGNHDWVVGDVSGDVGRAMRAEPVTMTLLESDIETTSPETQYRVEFTTPGTYYVWIRARANNGDSDSWHVGIDGQVVSSSDRMTIGNGFGEWRWINRTMDSERATIQVASSGLHTVNVWMREDGVYLDRILLTTDAGAEPNGEGPSESLRNEVTMKVDGYRLAAEELSPSEPEQPKAGFDLLGSFPNPFNPETTIQYVLHRRATVSLDVHDMLGRRVAVLIDEVQEEGLQNVRFSAAGLAGGVYVYRLRVDGSRASGSILLLP